jgi:predicted chitinase
VLDENGDKELSADEIHRGWEKPWFAQSLSRQIVQSKSEWGQPRNVYDVLDEYIRENTEDLKSRIDFEEVWNTEKLRIDALQFWNDVRGQHGFPTNISALHVHPLGLVENFIKDAPPVCRECGAPLTLTEEFLRRIMPRANQAFRNELILCSIELFPRYEVNTCRQIKHLLAQAKKETMEFTAFREDLYYTNAERAYSISPTAINAGFARMGLSFPTQAAKLTWMTNNVIRNDRAYGELLYGVNGRPGLDYRGRGLIHLTHYSAYQDCAAGTGHPVDDQPELLENDMRIVIESALWYWRNKPVTNAQANQMGGRSLPAIANNTANDGDNGVQNVTRIVTGSSTQGVKERQDYKREISPTFDLYFSSGCR